MKKLTQDYECVIGLVRVYCKAVKISNLPNFFNVAASYSVLARRQQNDRQFCMEFFSTHSYMLKDFQVVMIHLLSSQIFTLLG